MLHSLVAIWFTWVKDWGYAGVFILMALESTIVPVPSELVMPPAAFWAAQGQMNFWGVIAAGTLGSYLGSALSYAVFYYLGDHILKHLGRLPFLKKHQLDAAAKLIEKHGSFGIFFARMLPVVRHLISMPAGLFKMSFAKFSAMTLLGSGLWCYILSVWGQKIIGAHPELLNSPEEMMSVVRKELLSFVITIVLFVALYVAVQVLVLKKKTSTP